MIVCHTSDLLCRYLTRSGSLSTLIVKSSGLSDMAGAAIMAAVARNTVLKTLDLSGNDIGGTSDLLAAYNHDHGGQKELTLFPATARACRKLGHCTDRASETAMKKWNVVSFI